MHAVKERWGGLASRGHGKSSVFISFFTGRYVTLSIIDYFTWEALVQADVDLKLVVQGE